MAEQKIRIKRLKASMREKKRYVVVTFNKKLPKKQAYKLVDSALLEFLGLLGYAKANPKFIQFDAAKGKVIICVNRKELSDVKSALVLAGLACVGVSGILKKARQKFL